MREAKKRRGRGPLRLPLASLLMWLTMLAIVLHQTKAERKPWKTDNYTICTFPFPPMVECNPDGDPDTFTGHDIELMRILAERIGWKPVNYTFKCLPEFSSIFSELEKDEGSQCDIAAAGLTRSTRREKRGIQYTYPTYHSSLAIMVKSYSKEGSRFGFFRPLHWSVWVATILTTMAVPWLVFVVESLACHGFVHKGDWIPGIKEATWHSAVALLNFGHFHVKSTAARVIVFGYGFLVLIIINTYVANLAAFMTVTHVDTSVSTVEELARKRIATASGYVEQLRKIGITPVDVEQVTQLLIDRWQLR